jgi:hypothetical protein
MLNSGKYRGEQYNHPILKKSRLGIAHHKLFSPRAVRAIRRYGLKFCEFTMRNRQYPGLGGVAGRLLV